jgi:hypothetical protein
MNKHSFICKLRIGKRMFVIEIGAVVLTITKSKNGIEMSKKMNK